MTIIDNIPDIFKQYGKDVSRIVNSDRLKDARESFNKNPNLFIIESILEVMGVGYLTIQHKQALDYLYSRHGFKERYGANSMLLPNKSTIFVVLHNKIIIPSLEKEFPIKVIKSEFNYGVVVEFSPVDYLKFDALYIREIGKECNGPH